VVLTTPFALSFLLLKLTKSLHFLWSLGYDRSQVDFFTFRFLLQGRKLTHELIVLMSFFDEIVPISPEQPVYF